MSSKDKGAMPDENGEKSALVPRLRFPEFRDDGEWEQKKLGEVINLEYGSSLSENNRNGGAIPVVGSNGIVGYHDEYLVTGPAIVIGRKGSVGEVNWIDRDCYPIDTTYFVNNKKPKSYLLPFLNVLLQRSDLSRLKDPSAVPGLNRDSVHSLISCIPKPAEQQKIADCLSSLDDLIAAETQKLDALKTHKKGLMQQLFPREGETVPRLRFPEFREAGEWEEKTLGLVVEVASGQVDPTRPPYCDLQHVGGENIESDTGKIRDVKTAKELQLISGKYAFDETHILYSKIRPALNKVAAPDFKGICSADIYPIRPSTPDLRRDYLFYLLLSEAFSEYATKHSDRSKIPKVNRDSLLTYTVSLPLPVEQERIAGCLASLDDLIAAQSQKINALKTHKKGLMQQLFPVLDEVPA